MSITWHLRSSRPSSNTANRPTGPAPTITTSVSIGSVILVSVRYLQSGSPPPCGEGPGVGAAATAPTSGSGFFGLGGAPQERPRPNRHFGGADGLIEQIDRRQMPGLQRLAGCRMRHHEGIDAAS